MINISHRQITDLTNILEIIIVMSIKFKELHYFVRSKKVSMNKSLVNKDASFGIISAPKGKKQ